MVTLLWLNPTGSFAGNHDLVTGHYTVNGVCEQCKKRIEDASYTKGVRFALWNVDTHDLTIKYDSSKTTSGFILEIIAHAGHDNEKFTATDEEYNKLPSCCRYRSAIKKH